MPDRMAKLAIQLGAVEDDLLRMHRLDRADRNRELARIFDVDDQLGPAAGSNLANGAELLAAIGNKSLESNFDFFLHDASPVSTSRRTSARAFVERLICLPCSPRSFPRHPALEPQASEPRTDPSLLRRSCAPGASIA